MSAEVTRHDKRSRQNTISSLAQSVENHMSLWAFAPQRFKARGSRSIKKKKSLVQFSSGYRSY